jgi:hypothetical protein
VVLCPDPAEAAKCRQLIQTGHPGFDLAPIVIDSGQSPGRDGTRGPYLTAFAASMGGDAARHLLEAMMTTSEYEKTFVEKIHDQGIAEGEARGKAEGKAEAVLRLLDARRLAPSKRQRQQVTSCTDATQLDLWFDRAITAGTAAEVFAD